jgi:hypothetical protein
MSTTQAIRISSEISRLRPIQAAIHRNTHTTPPEGSRALAEIWATASRAPTTIRWFITPPGKYPLNGSEPRRSSSVSKVTIYGVRCREYAGNEQRFVESRVASDLLQGDRSKRP